MDYCLFLCWAIMQLSHFCSMTTIWHKMTQMTLVSCSTPWTQTKLCWGQILWKYFLLGMDYCLLLCWAIRNLANFPQWQQFVMKWPKWHWYHVLHHEYKPNCAGAKFYRSISCWAWIIACYFAGQSWNLAIFAQWQTYDMKWPKWHWYHVLHPEHYPNCAGAKIWRIFFCWADWKFF